ncbi:hypothetical protein SNE40_004236 [Patella caerulea]|uniref:Cilia- and flagella-associated protein 251 n=1 Tax=Patella caerulea TaxID=87958 RepID=A0AAN8KIH7_PATCE
MSDKPESPKILKTPEPSDPDMENVNQLSTEQLQQDQENSVTENAPPMAEQNVNNGETEATENAAEVKPDESVNNGETEATENAAEVKPDESVNVKEENDGTTSSEPEERGDPFEKSGSNLSESVNVIKNQNADQDHEDGENGAAANEQSVEPPTENERQGDQEETGAPVAASTEEHPEQVDEPKEQGEEQQDQAANKENEVELEKEKTQDELKLEKEKIQDGVEPEKEKTQDGVESEKEKTQDVVEPGTEENPVVSAEATGGELETRETTSPQIPVAPPVNQNMLPSVPRLLSPDQDGTETSMEGTMSNSALNIIWSFGLNRDVPVLNLTDKDRKMILYPCAHVGVLYDFQNNKQHILQGHTNAITCTCVSEDKKWLVTGDKGEDAMVIVWDTTTGTPIQTLFDLNPDGGVVAVALTPDARYLATLSSARSQLLSIWDWTIDGESPICTAQLSPDYGVQNYIYFNPEDFHYLVTNSSSQVIFCHWDERCLEYFAPPLSDQDFNKQVGNYSQSIFQSNSSRALTGTSIGNLVVWDNNKPLTKVVSTEQSADKKALKIIKLQERGINVLTTTDKYIVVGDMAGHVKFFDQTLKLIYWYQDFHLGPITSVSFSHIPEFAPIAPEGSKYPGDATISAKNFVIRDFVVGTNIAIFGNVTADGTKVQVIHREHDAAIHALSAHPKMPYLVIGSYSGLIQIWNYEKRTVMVSRTFERGLHIRCSSFDPKGEYLAVGFTNGTVRILDAITLNDEMSEPFRYSRDAITHLVFSHNSVYLAAADAEHSLTVYKKQNSAEDPFDYLGRYRAHYKPINDVLFGIHLDSNLPRLMSLGEDRVLVEYDLVASVRDNLVIASSDRIEQSGIPKCMAWYPPITKEHFLITANDQYKFKLFNATTKMCRRTLLGPTYGSPVLKVSILPTKEQTLDGMEKRYLAYHTEDKVGLHILPLDGNPHNSMALIAHPSGVSNLVCSYDGRYLFTAGGSDSAVHMWEVNINALEAQSRLGGEDLLPFYGLLDGGREGELFSELEDYFYYGQIRNQGVDSQEIRKVSTKIQLAEVPFVMRALGFYPSEQEIEDMMNEVKFSEYVETGQYVEEIDLGEFIKLYVNHRPAFGLSPDKVLEAFDILGIPTSEGCAVERGELLDILQSKGEHMTEYELAEYLSTLLGHNLEGGSSELHNIDPVEAGELIDQNLPHQITADMFSKQILGFSMYTDAISD